MSLVAIGLRPGGSPNQYKKLELPGRTEKVRGPGVLLNYSRSREVVLLGVKTSSVMSPGGILF